MVIMPNHFYCIIENIAVPNVGADLCVCPDKIPPQSNIAGAINGTTTKQWEIMRMKRRATVGAIPRGPNEP